jgi:hypothetical protein
MALAKVKSLTLAFNTGEEHPNQVTAELEDCANYLRESDALQKFLSACPSLTSLDIGFGSISPEAQAASLEHVVGETTWNSLRQIAFHRFRIPVERFLLFLERHEDSLSEVVLDDMCIVRLPETWSSLLSGVRDLNITWTWFLTIETLHQDGLQDGAFYANSYGEENCPYAAEMIEDYVTGKTSFDPLKAAMVDEEPRETIWHDEWEDTSDDEEMEVTEV